MTVRLFAAARELARARQIDVELPDGATVADLFEAIAQSHPKLGGIAAASRIAVNQDFATPQQPIKASDEIALIPPVSGG